MEPYEGVLSRTEPYGAVGLWSNIGAVRSRMEPYEAIYEPYGAFKGYLTDPKSSSQYNFVNEKFKIH